jgi:two-component system chemotaxis response regulator CheB
MNKKIRVLIVDDSSLVRQMLTDILTECGDIEVVGVANDPLIARDRIKALNPDVLTLDVEMPRMDGLTFLSNLMRLRPMPVIMVSSLTERGAQTTLRALELGAVDFVSKPKVDIAGTLRDFSDEICAKVRCASRARVRAHIDTPPAPVTPKYSADAVLPALTSQRRLRTTERIIAIGASTGGTEAIRTVLQALPADGPAVVIAQHIPAAFSGAFTHRMDSISAMSVCEPRDGQQIVPGHVYIAPGDRHLMVERDGARYLCRLSEGPPVNRHRPSVDVLFRSVAQNVGRNAVGAILTGMGDDGARGMREMSDAGAPTLAQDEATSVVWGMPGAAVKHGGVTDVVALDRIADMVLRLAASGAETPDSTARMGAAG